MVGKTKKMINQESREDYGNKGAEGATALPQGDGKFDGADEKFEEARAEENAFDAGRAEESTARSHLQRAGNMAGCATVTANDPKEEEE